MSTNGQSVKWHRNIAKNFNRLSIGCTNVIDRQTTDGRATAYSERVRDFTFSKSDIPNFTKFSVHVICSLTYTFTCSVLHCYALIMAALCNTTGHYIFVLWFFSFFLLLSSFFFPRLFSVFAYWMSTILPHMVWP